MLFYYSTKKISFLLFSFVNEAQEQTSCYCQKQDNVNLLITNL